MQEKVLPIVAFERIDDLLVLAGPEGRHRQGLGLAAGKQRRTVGARQNADLARDRPHRSRIAAVDPPPAAHDRAADDFLFDFLEQLQRQGALGLVGEKFVELRLGRVETVAAVLLAHLAVGGFDQRADRFAQPGLHHRLFRQLRRQAPRVAGAGLGELDDRRDHRLEFAVTEHDGAEHDFLGELLRRGFDHQHAVGGAGDHEVEL